MEVTCSHGLGLSHLIIDLWLMGCLIGIYPIYYIKNKIFTKNDES